MFFLVLLTQFNDVAQYTWGKLFGRHKITPTVSPKKTWEGFLGGAATTVVVAGLIGPYLDADGFPWSGLAGVIIAVAGFLGDITQSAVKRDLGVKDAGGLIPGPWRHTRPGRQPDLRGAGLHPFLPLFLLPMNNALRWLFFAVLVRLLVLLVLGLNMRHRERLPRKARR